MRVLDKEIASAARDHWETAYELHYASLARFAALVSGKPDLGEDLAQEAFIRSASALGALDERAVPEYLRRTVINLWKNRLRRLSLERRTRVQGTPASAPSIEDMDPVWRAVRRLPARQRACLVLRYYEDLPVKAAARVMGVSPGTVKTQSSRALRKLRKELGDEHRGAGQAKP
jgi:RNA polymerase sigma-70 factor, ECF subfamily